MPTGPRIAVTSWGRTTLPAWLLVLALAANPAPAGDDDDLVNKSRQPAANEQRSINVPNIGAMIDNWVYRNDEGGGSPQERLESQLRMKVDSLGRSFGIPENQKQKLLLAGQGDIRRLVDRVEQFKSHYRSERITVDEWRRVRQEAQKLREPLSGDGLFAGDSLFAKTLASILSPEQIASLDRVEVERRDFQHRAGVHMTVLRLSTALGLSDEQWQGLEDLLLKETRPARFEDRPYPAAYFNVVYAQMRSIPQEKLQPIFEPWQWRIMQRKLQQAPGFAGGNGIVLDGKVLRRAVRVPAVNAAPDPIPLNIRVGKIRPVAPKEAITK
jgi:hypothetical protein